MSSPKELPRHGFYWTKYPPFGWIIVYRAPDTRLYSAVGGQILANQHLELSHPAILSELAEDFRLYVNDLDFDEAL